MGFIYGSEALLLGKGRGKCGFFNELGYGEAGDAHFPLDQYFVAVGSPLHPNMGFFRLFKLVLDGMLERLAWFSCSGDVGKHPPRFNMDIGNGSGDDIESYIEAGDIPTVFKSSFNRYTHPLGDFPWWVRMVGFANLAPKLVTVYGHALTQDITLLYVSPQISSPVGIPYNAPADVATRWAGALGSCENYITGNWTETGFEVSAVLRDCVRSVLGEGVEVDIRTRDEQDMPACGAYERDGSGFFTDGLYGNFDNAFDEAGLMIADAWRDPLIIDYRVYYPTIMSWAAYIAHIASAWYKVGGYAVKRTHKMTERVRTDRILWNGAVEHKTDMTEIQETEDDKSTLMRAYNAGTRGGENTTCVLTFRATVQESSFLDIEVGWQCPPEDFNAKLGDGGWSFVSQWSPDAAGTDAEIALVSREMPLHGVIWTSADTGGKMNDRLYTDGWASEFVQTATIVEPDCGSPVEDEETHETKWVNPWWPKLERKDAADAARNFPWQIDRGDLTTEMNAVALVASGCSDTLKNREWNNTKGARTPKWTKKWAVGRAHTVIKGEGEGQKYVEIDDPDLDLPYHEMLDKDYKPTWEAPTVDVNVTTKRTKAWGTFNLTKMTQYALVRKWKYKEGGEWKVEYYSLGMPFFIRLPLDGEGSNVAKKVFKDNINANWDRKEWVEYNDVGYILRAYATAPVEYELLEEKGCGGCRYDSDVDREMRRNGKVAPTGKALMSVYVKQVKVEGFMYGDVSMLPWYVPYSNHDSFTERLQIRYSTTIPWWVKPGWDFIDIAGKG